MGIENIMKISNDLLEGIIKKGLWGLRPKNIPVITYPEDYKKSEWLDVVCTQIYNLKPIEQRKLVEKWCEVLPNLEKVKYLFFSCNVPQNIFESVCLMPSLELLFIKCSSVNDISSLAKLKSVRYFHLGSSTKVESIGIFGNMENLIYLSLENIKKINDIKPLSNLKNLMCLSICGSVWTTQVVETLEPLKYLQKLQYLNLINLKTNDKTIKFLEEVKSLNYINGPYFYPKGFKLFSEFDYLKKINPNLIIEHYYENKEK